MLSEKAARLVSLVVAGFLAGWATPARAAGPAPAKPPRSVLVLYSNGRLLPANVEFDQGLRAALLATPGPAPEIFDEFLDVPRFATSEHLRTMETYLRDKYRAAPPTLLVTAGEEALQFLAEHRRALFPEVPLVYAAVARSALAGLAPLPPDFVGVPQEIDFAGTIEQAMRWHPAARHLWIVTGASEWDRRNESRLRLAAEAFADRLQIDFLPALPIAEVERRLGDLGADSIVFTPGIFQDGAGHQFVPRDSVVAIAAASAAPVYGGYATILGTGAVGGSVSSFADSGREAGREAALLLAGTPPAALALPLEVPSSLHVDWRQIRRFEIDPRAIPAEAVVHFREPTLFEAHPYQALLAVSALALQAGLIALLLVERRRRHAAEVAAHERRRELAHASRLAVAGEMVGSIAHEINQPLGAILANADAADLILASGGDRRSELAEILADIRRDDLRASEVIRKLRAFLTRHEVERRPFEIHEVVRAVESMLRAEARRRRVALEVRPAALAATILGDRIQLQQVLMNLALNAMDAVGDLPEERRSVLLVVRTGFGGAEVEVRDRGQGIPPDELPKLFESFYTTKSQGMGLGLSIARTLVDAHGGRIRVESELGQGTAFHVELPVVSNPPGGEEENG